MATVVEVDVGKKKEAKREPLDQRVILMTTKSWADRADAKAISLGLSLAAYIRMVVEQDLQSDDAQTSHRGHR